MFQDHPGLALEASADCTIASEIPMADRVDIARMRSGDWVRVRDGEVMVERGR